MTFGLAMPTTNASARIRRSSPRRDRHVERGRELAAVAEGLHAEVDEVQRAGELDDREDRDRLLHDRADPERDEHDLHVDAGGVADDGREPARRPSVSERVTTNSTLGPGTTMSTVAMTMNASRCSVGSIDQA